MKNIIGVGGLVVSILAFFSDNSSSNPAEFCNGDFVNKNENKLKRGRVVPIEKMLGTLGDLNLHKL